MSMGRRKKGRYDARSKEASREEKRRKKTRI